MEFPAYHSRVCRRNVPFFERTEHVKKYPKSTAEINGEVIPDIVKGIGFEEARGGEIILLIIFCLIAAVMVGKILYKGFKKQNIATAADLSGLIRLSCGNGSNIDIYNNRKFSTLFFCVCDRICIFCGFDGWK